MFYSLGDPSIESNPGPKNTFTLSNEKNSLIAHGLIIQILLKQKTLYLRQYLKHQKELNLITRDLQHKLKLAAAINQMIY